MALLGTSAIVAAFVLSLLTVVFGAMGGRWESRRYAELSRLTLQLTTGAVLVAAAALLYSFVVHDFSLRYVAGRSAMRMPIFYVVAAFWGGQEGSLLFWITLVATFGAAASWANRHRIPRVMPYFHAVLGGNLAGLLFILVFVTPPFAAFTIVDAPMDGDGLNPLLQNPLMTIHPPTLLGGLATFAVPYAFGMGALLARDTGSEWLKATRKWTLISWLLLSVGNVLGGMWAYRELGWGGYWAWDPVENAALIPWFAASAYLHSVIIQEQRGMFRRWNAILVALTFCLTLLGTWMTRSGLIESVHTFAESEIGDYFLALLLGSIAFSAYVIATRWRGLHSDHQLDSTVSREGAFLLNNWLFMGIGFVVLWGTLFPKFKEMVTGQAVAIGPAWFNQFTAPLGIGLLALMALGTLLPWRRTSWRAFRRGFTIPSVATLLVVPSSMWLYFTTRGEALGVDAFTTAVALAIVTWALIVFNTVTLTLEFWRGTRARMNSMGADPFTAFQSLLSKHRRRYGGYTVHLGILAIFLAFLGNAVKADVDATLAVGQEVELGDYTVRFDGLETVPKLDKAEIYASLTLSRNGEPVGQLRPARFDYNDYSMLAGENPDPMKITSEIFIRSTPVEDVYVALLTVDPEREVAAFKMVILPFTWWFWVGGLILVAGTLICMWPEEDRLKRQYWRYRALRRLELGAIAATIVVPAALFMGQMEAWAEEAESAQVDEHEGHDHAEHDYGAPMSSLTGDQARTADEAFGLIMTTCGGCAGKSLAYASPSCAPSNADKAVVRDMVAGGASLDQVLGHFVAERGEAALAVPPDSAFNRLVWLIPGLAIVAGIWLLGVWSRRWTRAGRRPLANGDDADNDSAYFDQLEDELASRA